MSDSEKVLARVALAREAGSASRGETEQLQRVLADQRRENLVPLEGITAFMKQEAVEQEDRDQQNLDIVGQKADRKAFVKHEAAEQEDVDQQDVVEQKADKAFVKQEAAEQEDGDQLTLDVVGQKADIKLKKCVLQ